MLNVPTLWMVFVTNFLALSLVWAYVMHSYPKFDTARYWTVATAMAAVGAAVSMFRSETATAPLPLLLSAVCLLMAGRFAVMGVARFYGERSSWLATVLIVGLTMAGMVYFMFVHDDMPMRIAIFSLGQAISVVATLKLLWIRRDGRKNPGAGLATLCGALILGIYAARSVCALLGVGGDVSIVSFNPLQAMLILFLIFLSMAWNFGFLLMAIERLRNEVADLALLDDLTGVGNRRHLVQRLTEQCASSMRSGQPFALLVIDLDGFKGINDTHGHVAGDACLQHFTLMAQTRLRPGDMLARSGGDEFCVVLPNSTVQDGAMIARRILDVCRQDAAQCVGADIPISVSIGVAQWSGDVGAFPERLIAAADQALYDAKKGGRNDYAVYEATPPLVPDADAVLEPALPKPAQV
ncbi:MAG TPA: GGDEF domain-containing protein [Bradyrhizobium sp.]|nr:GGDEF domain-containing protein [Bradyrhizobium sp.]